MVHRHLQRAHARQKRDTDRKEVDVTFYAGHPVDYVNHNKTKKFGQTRYTIIGLLNSKVHYTPLIHMYTETSTLDRFVKDRFGMANSRKPRRPKTH